MKFGSEFWDSLESPLLINPRFPDELKDRLQSSVNQQTLSGVVWLKSSGTESGSINHKLVALSKKAILTAAQSVNLFFKVTASDVWLNPLPEFHIGGLSIYARCVLAKAKCVTFSKWGAEEFYSLLEKEKATIASLVPTQVYDLIQARLRAPSSLRLVLVGGGALQKEVYLQGRALGWPLIPSYGMTETAALVAAAPLPSLENPGWPEAQILDHVNLQKVADHYQLQSASLFEGFLWVNPEGEWTWQPRPEPFILDDRIEVRGRTLRVLGRTSEIVKILGETVNLLHLKETLQNELSKNIFLVPAPEPRRGFDLHLVVESQPFDLSLEQINKERMPYEKISKIHFVAVFPRTELGKVKSSELMRTIFQQC